MSPARRREPVRYVMGALAGSQRWTCKTLGQIRSTQRHESLKCNADDSVRMRIIASAKEYGRYGYRMICAMMQMEDWKVNHKLVCRVWREEGLKVPSKLPRRAKRKNHVWNFDFVTDQTSDG